MKKLNLQLGSIKAMLTKEQMKKVAGGYNTHTDIVCHAFDPGHPSIWYNCDVSGFAYDNLDLGQTEIQCFLDCQDMYGQNCDFCFEQ